MALYQTGRFRSLRQLLQGRVSNEKGPDITIRPFFSAQIVARHTIALTAIFACSSAWYEERTNGPDATFLKPIL